ncbi:hypothetical protein [Paraburkholderia youngii]|uniref:hypothetical protein n=1 Tax=Paraburkholderia youngii TaxID=2782701 RepID=UPI003D1BA2E4
MQAVIGHVDVLVDSTADMTGQNQADRMLSSGALQSFLMRACLANRSLDSEDGLIEEHMLPASIQIGEVVVALLITVVGVPIADDRARRAPPENAARKSGLWRRWEVRYQRTSKSATKIPAEAHSTVALRATKYHKV